MATQPTGTVEVHESQADQLAGHRLYVVGTKRGQCGLKLVNAGAFNLIQVGCDSCAKRQAISKLLRHLRERQQAHVLTHLCTLGADVMLGHQAKSEVLISCGQLQTLGLTRALDAASALYALAVANNEKKLLITRRVLDPEVELELLVAEL